MVWFHELKGTQSVLNSRSFPSDDDLHPGQLLVPCWLFYVPCGAGSHLVARWIHQAAVCELQGHWDLSSGEPVRQNGSIVRSGDHPIAQGCPVSRACRGGWNVQ